MPLMLTFLVPLVFLPVFCLYRLDWEPFLYTSLLYELIWLLLWAAGWIRYHEKQKKLLTWKQSVLTGWEEIPDAETAPEQHYVDMIRILGEKARTLSEAQQQDREQLRSYYTVWVHQIKTPISVMRMMLQAEDTEEHRALMTELFRIEQYAEMALNYIRLEESDTDLVIRNADLDSVIRGCIRKYAPQLIAQKLAIRYDGTELKVMTDEKWLSFILEQLLSNAVKYTPSGSVTIRVAPEGLLTVTDTGIGIAPEDLPRIFEKGFTGENGHRDKRATGLGLYLCRKTADRLGIRLTAESRVGKGTCITLVLPLDKGTIPD